MSALVVLQQMAVIAVLVCIGVYLEKKGVLGEKVTGSISRLIVEFCNPALTVSAVISGNITVSHSEFLTGLGIGAALYTTLCLLGYIIPLLLRVKKDERKYYTLMTIYTNVGFLGIPVARAVLPENAMIYVIICNVAYSILFYTHGMITLSDGKEKPDLRKMINPGVIMAAAALLIFWFDIKLPAVVANSLSYIGSPTVFLSMILLGSAVAKSSLSDMKDKRLWLFTLFRIAAVPAAAVLILRITGIPSEMVRTFCLMCSVPVGNLPLIQAQRTGQRTDILSRGIIITTVFSFISITFFMSLV